jgi:hypothetical protein
MAKRPTEYRSEPKGPSVDEQLAAAKSHPWQRLREVHPALTSCLARAAGTGVRRSGVRRLAPLSRCRCQTCDFPPLLETLTHGLAVALS